MSSTTSCDHEHGTRSRAAKRSCHATCSCTPCRAANAAYARSRNRNLRQGNPLTVPVGPVRQQLAAWRAQGHGPTVIAVATGLGRRHLKDIENGKRKRILAVTADTIMTAKPQVTTYVHPAGTRRRLRAMAAAGFSAREIGAALPANPDYLAHLTYARTDRHATVTGSLADAVTRLYDNWCTSDSDRPRSAWVRNWARKRGCLPAEAWTDATVDDPNAKPWQGVRAAHLDTDAREHDIRVERLCEGMPVLGPTPAERRAAIQVLHARGLNDHLISGRIRMSPRSILRIRTDLGLAAAHDVGTRAGAA